MRQKHDDVLIETLTISSNRKRLLAAAYTDWTWICLLHPIRLVREDREDRRLPTSRHAPCTLPTWAVACEGVWAARRRLPTSRHAPSTLPTWGPELWAVVACAGRMSCEKTPTCFPSRPVHVGCLSRGACEHRTGHPHDRDSGSESTEDDGKRLSNRACWTDGNGTYGCLLPRGKSGLAVSNWSLYQQQGTTCFFLLL